MGNTIDFTYRFNFADGESVSFTVALDPASLTAIAHPTEELPDWALLTQNRCDSCTLDPVQNRYCPVARNLAGIVSEFKDCFSYQDVHVTVVTAERKYAQATTLQQGLSALIGLVMATSGCPVLDYLKPMARFHLPFASVEETEYRMVSMYLVAQYYLHAEGKPADLDLAGLKEICSNVSKLNAAFAIRFREAAKNDANINALVNLDCFAKSIPYTVRDRLKEYRCFFAPYLSL